MATVFTTDTTHSNINNTTTHQVHMAESYQLKAVHWTNNCPYNEKQTCIHSLSTSWSNATHKLVESSYITTCFSGGRHHHQGRQHHRSKKHHCYKVSILSHLSCMYKQQYEICIHLSILHLPSVSYEYTDTKNATGPFCVHKTLTNPCDKNK